MTKKINFDVDLSTIYKCAPKDFEILATIVEIPFVGKVWLLVKESLSYMFDSNQVAMKMGRHYLLADDYPVNSYIVQNKDNEALKVVNSLMLSGTDHEIKAKRRYFEGKPLWEVLDGRLKKDLILIQFVLRFNGRIYYPDEYKIAVDELTEISS